MNNISSFAPFVEFIGAFCFAFVLTDWSEKLFKHILRVEEMFRTTFDSIQSEIDVDKVSLDNMDPLELKDGRTNKEELNRLKSNYSKLISQREETEAICSNHIKKYHRPHFTKQLFLMFGLYAVADIFGMCLLQYYEHESTVHIIRYRLSLFNLLMFLCLCYFVIAELLYWQKKGSVSQFWISPFLRVIWIMIALFLCCVLLPSEKLINCEAGILCLILPLSPFIFCFILSLVMFRCSKHKVNNASKDLIIGFKSLHKEKEHIDKMYAIFSNIAPDFEINES